MLVVFTVRPYDCKDLNSVISIYQAVFAEPPWNESWTREEVIEDLMEQQIVKDGDYVIITKGDLQGHRGGTNNMKILQVGQATEHSL
mgnify:CR=1 FL=1